MARRLASSAVVDAITAEGGKARFLAADLADADELAAFAEEVGAVDILVNNVGIGWFGPTNTLDLATYDEIFNTNVRSAYFLVAALAPKMAKKKSGSIVNVGSAAGTVGLAGGAAYSATKAALASFTRSWAAEYTAAGIRVNTIAPGPVYTGVPHERTEATGATTLMERAAQSSEIAPLIAFLVSPSASYVTGTLFAAAGGRTAVREPEEWVPAPRWQQLHVPVPLCAGPALVAPVAARDPIPRRRINLDALSEVGTRPSAIWPSRLARAASGRSGSPATAASTLFEAAASPRYRPAPSNRRSEQTGRVERTPHRDALEPQVGTGRA